MLTAPITFMPHGPLGLEPKAEALLADGGRQRIAALIPALEAVSTWSPEGTEAAVRHLLRRTG